MSSQVSISACLISTATNKASIGRLRDCNKFAAQSEGTAFLFRHETTQTCSDDLHAGLPKPVGNGDHHVHESTLRNNPTVLVKDDRQPLPPQHLGLGQQGLGSLACNEGHLIWSSATWHDVNAIHGIVEAEQQLQSWHPAHMACER